MVSEGVRTRVERILRGKGALPEDRHLLWMDWSGDGVRLSVVAPGPRNGTTVEEKTVTVGKPHGSFRDQVNGIVGAFMSR